MLTKPSQNCTRHAFVWLSRSATHLSHKLASLALVEPLAANEVVQHLSCTAVVEADPKAEAVSIHRTHLYRSSPNNSLLKSHLLGE